MPCADALQALSRAINWLVGWNKPLDTAEVRLAGQWAGPACLHAGCYPRSATLHVCLSDWVRPASQQHYFLCAPLCLCQPAGRKAAASARMHVALRFWSTGSSAAHAGSYLCPGPCLQDVREVGLTGRSLQKVLEVVQTGRCSRADGVAGSESMQVGLGTGLKPMDKGCHAACDMSPVLPAAPVPCPQPGVVIMGPPAFACWPADWHVLPASLNASLDAPPPSPPPPAGPGAVPAGVGRGPEDRRALVLAGPAHAGRRAGSRRGAPPDRAAAGGHCRGAAGGAGESLKAGAQWGAVQRCGGQVQGQSEELERSH